LRENAIQLLATRGYAKAQRIFGNLYFFGGKTMETYTTTPIWANKDKAEGMAWYGRAGAQGDLFAQKLCRDLTDKVNTNHVWTDVENIELGFWISRNCPALC
jgi:TPR repeat protein